MDDTTPDACERQFARWRQMSPAEKLRQAASMRTTVLRFDWPA